jgi:hypothetical protein
MVEWKVMSNFLAAIDANKDMPVDAQKKAGQAQGDDMDDEHKQFLALVIGMLDRKQIDVYKPETFLKKDVYDSLSEEWKSKVDVAMLNIALQLRQIEWFYRSKTTPNASPELQNMIEHLWQMKQRIEDHYDVFVF